MSFTPSFYNALIEAIPEIVSKVIIYIMLAFLTSTINEIRLNYFNKTGKNKYIKLLQKNFPHIKKYLDVNKTFTRINQVYLPVTVVFGSIFGGIITAGVASINVVLFVIIIVLVKGFENWIDSNLTSFQQDIIILPIILDLSILIIIKKWLIKYKSIKSKSLITVSDERLCELKKSQVIDYLLMWFHIGILFGASFLPTVLLYYLIYTEELYEGTSADLISLTFSLIISSALLLVCFYYLVDLIRTVYLFCKAVIDKITGYHQSLFPNLSIKTSYGEIKGQINDIQDESLVTIIDELDEKKLHIIQWDKIKTLEARFINKNR